MKQNIINLLRTTPGLTTNRIVTTLNLRRGSVSKCLTRLIASGEVVRKNAGAQSQEYFLPLQPTPSPAPQTVNA